MREYNIYLGGAMGSKTYEDYMGWRVDATKKLNEAGFFNSVSVNVFNPAAFFNFEEIRHKSELEVMKFDLGLVKRSDVVLVNLDGINQSIGTAIECFLAYERNIPVIAYGDISSVHPWVVNCILRHEDTIEGAIEYIKEFFLL